MGGPASHFLAIFELKSAFISQGVVFRLEVTAFGWRLLGFIEFASNASFATLQALRRVFFMLTCSFGRRWVGDFVVGLRKLGPQLFGEFIIVMELEEVIDEVLVDILRLRLQVQLLEQVEDLKLLVDSAIWSEIRMVFLLQQRQFSLQVQRIVLVLDQHAIELFYQQLSAFLLSLGRTITGLTTWEAPAEGHLFLLVLHLPNVVAQQLSDLSANQVFLLLGGLHFRKHGHCVHAHLRDALVNEVVLRDGGREAGERGIPDGLLRVRPGLERPYASGRGWW